MAALAGRVFPPELIQHLESCVCCSESALVWRYLDELSKDEADQEPLPSADRIWWKAQFAKKRKLAERSVLAISLVQKVAAALAAAFMVLVAVLWGPAMAEQLAFPMPLILTAMAILIIPASGLALLWVPDSQRQAESTRNGSAV